MKKTITLILAFLLLCFGLSACTDLKDNNDDNDGDGGNENSSPTTAANILVTYFSCTGNTEKIAEMIARETGGALHEIQPQIPYTEADLDYYSGGRADREQADPAARPAIANSVENMPDYDVIFLGYPIWHGQAPKIIYTFLESYDFAGKTIVPFCTSGSSGVGSSADNLRPLAQNADWKNGTRFSSNTTESEIKAFVEQLNLDLKTDTNMLKISVGNTTLTASLTDNASAAALFEALKKSSLTIEMQDYGNFEKVGTLGFSLPRSDEYFTTEAGDLILYQGNQFVIYYDTNSWNFTRLGKIENITASELRSILGSGNVTVILSV